MVVSQANQIVTSHVCDVAACATSHFARTQAMEADAVDFVHHSTAGYEVILDEVFFRAKQWLDKNKHQRAAAEDEQRVSESDTRLIDACSSATYYDPSSEFVDGGATATSGNHFKKDGVVGQTAAVMSSALVAKYGKLGGNLVKSSLGKSAIRNVHGGKNISGSEDGRRGGKGAGNPVVNVGGNGGFSDARGVATVTDVKGSNTGGRGDGNQGERVGGNSRSKGGKGDGVQDTIL